MAQLPFHQFISSDGGLYDTRPISWSGRPALRANYAISHKLITSTADLKATLRAGPYAWPGGYPLYFITSDGEALSFESVRENLAQCLWSLMTNSRDGWRIIACDVNYEDVDLTCAHSGKPIEVAYDSREDQAVERS